MNMKRKREGEELTQPSARTKRRRSDQGFDLLKFSDELILRTLSFLSTKELIKVERVCKKLQRLASDNSIWRQKFYQTFIKPRIKRLPVSKIYEEPTEQSYAARVTSKSLKNRVTKSCKRGETPADWKREYKIKLNWSNGRADIRQLDLGKLQTRQVLAKMSDGIIYTVDAYCGLRAWSQRETPQLLHAQDLPDGRQVPTALAVSSESQALHIVVAYADGAFTAHTFDQQHGFSTVAEFTTDEQRPIASVAVAWPYVLTMSSTQSINLYYLLRQSHAAAGGMHVTSCLLSLKAEVNYAVNSLSLRKTSSVVVASVAYIFSRIGEQWCIGLQEIRVSAEGTVMKSRLVSSVDTPIRDPPLRALSNTSIVSRSASAAPLALHPHMTRCPNSLSHAGCYILAGLPDNTLMVYTVVSTDEKLEIQAGRRLWGHTSAISSTMVNGTGKALSLSSKNGEMRFWELEEILGSFTHTRTSTLIQPRSDFDKLHTAISERGNGLGLAFWKVESGRNVFDSRDEGNISSRWVGFDDEQITVLGEKDHKTVLSVLDFA